MKRGYPIGAVLAPLILGTLLAFSNWRLIRENRELSATAHYYASLRHTLAGVQVPAIHGKDLAGHDIDIAYRNGNRQTLLFVFSPTCPHCKRNWPAWLDLVKASPDKRVVFANVGGTLPPNFSEVYSFDSATVLASTSPETVLAYSLFEFPLTILISPTGRTESVKVGELSRDDVNSFTPPRP